ncbi:hypothetical protein DEO72_LG3g1340 [Vigna unguiculata]|uniref:Uncharacterized protein n=1 Tax=Vigna unguiculata TaxID=3917 RepID=A0A4D6LEZ7_VIGUN|nr:hypothetical protein DEO72_LG3g1340 [Vigna unguiculata]
MNWYALMFDTILNSTKLPMYPMPYALFLSKVTKLLKYHHITDKDDGLGENAAKSASNTNEDDSTTEEEDHTMANATDNAADAATDDKNYSTAYDMSD